jgi:hypothetical protein
VPVFCLFHQEDADMWLLGMDQTGAQMLSRQYCDLIKMENRPIAFLNGLSGN